MLKGRDSLPLVELAQPPHPLKHPPVVQVLEQQTLAEPARADDVDDERQRAPGVADGLGGLHVFGKGFGRYQPPRLLPTHAIWRFTETFEKNLGLLTEDGRYNLLAQMLSEIRNDSNVTEHPLQSLLGVGKTTVDNGIAALKGAGLIQRVGSNKSGYWEATG